MTQTIQIGEIKVDVIQKDIKNIHLSVYPPVGKVRISAPMKFDLDTIRIFAISKLSWIKKQQEKFRKQERESEREYLSRETHYYFGRRYLLKVVESHSKSTAEIKHNTLVLYVRPNTDAEKHKVILQEWYREQLRAIVTEMIAKWQKRLGVHVEEFGIKKMKTKWGTCNPKANRIWVNLELAKKPLDLIEYIIVHEMVHLIERTHNERYIAYMNKYLPQWKQLREELNRLPISHVEWGY